MCYPFVLCLRVMALKYLSNLKFRGAHTHFAQVQNNDRSPRHLYDLPRARDIVLPRVIRLLLASRAVTSKNHRDTSFIHTCSPVCEYVI